MPAPAATGHLIFYGYCWDFGLPPRSPQADLKESSGISSAEVVYGAPLVLPSQLSGIPESPPVVFKEDIRSVPSFIPSRAPSTSPPDAT